MVSVVTERLKVKRSTLKFSEAGMSRERREAREGVRTVGSDRILPGQTLVHLWCTQVTNLRYSRLKICATVRGELGGAAAPVLSGNSGPKSLKAYIGFIRLT